MHIVLRKVRADELRRGGKGRWQRGPSVPHIPSIADVLTDPRLQLGAFKRKHNQHFGSETPKSSVVVRTQDWGERVGQDGRSRNAARRSDESRVIDFVNCTSPTAAESAQARNSK